MNKSILLVGSATGSLTFLAILLEQKNYKTKVCYQFQEVMQWLETSQFDLVIIDDQKPKLNAVELCSQLKANPHTANIPILLLLSAANAANDGTIGIEQCQSTVRKPILPHLLIEEVKNTLS